MWRPTRTPMRCRRYEARLEDYLGGASDAELADHLDRCAGCRAALEDARLAGTWLRQAREPAREPGRAFLAGVMATIREEERRAQSPAAFWRPLEFLASRLSLTAAMLLLALSVYVVKFAPRGHVPPPSRTEVSAADDLQPPADPVSNEEVLQSLAERNYGR